METKEAILATISELSEMSESSAQDNAQDLEKDSNKAESSQNKGNIFIDIKEESASAKPLDDELSVLENLKEKSLVLFEGLRSAQKADLEIKLEMVISYLEYQLYIIEERLEKLTKGA